MAHIKPFFIAAGWEQQDAEQMNADPGTETGHYLSSDAITSFRGTEEDGITKAYVRHSNTHYFIPASFETVKAVMQDHGYEFTTVGDLKKKEKGGNRIIPPAPGPGQM